MTQLDLCGGGGVSLTSDAGLEIISVHTSSLNRYCIIYCEPTFNSSFLNSNVQNVEFLV